MGAVFFEAALFRVRFFCSFRVLAGWGGSRVQERPAQAGSLEFWEEVHIIPYPKRPPENISLGKWKVMHQGLRMSGVGPSQRGLCNRKPMPDAVSPTLPASRGLPLWSW